MKKHSKSNTPLPEKLRAAGEPSERESVQGMRAVVRRTEIRYMVLAYSMERFMEWVKREERSLQACKYVGKVEDMKGVGFSSPLMELVALDEWWRGHDNYFANEGFRLIGLYCRDKRVHDVPRT
jgi:hypothetical protein